MPIHHIVLLKFKQGIDPSDADKVRESLRNLPSQIPFISGIKAGDKIKHPLDHDFDEGVIFVFKDQEALSNYIPHEAHRSYQAFTAPYIEEKLIFDISSEE